MSAPVHAAADVLSMGSDWEAQNKSEATNKDRAEATKADGDFLASDPYGSLKTGTVSYIYIGSGASLSAALVTANAWPGQIKNSLLITQVDVDYAPCAQGQKPMVTFSYRGDITTESAAWISSLTLPLGTGAVPDLLTNSDADSECTSAKYTIKCEVGVNRGDDGEIIAGLPYHGEETLELEYYGIPTLTTTGWDDTTNPGAADSNTEYSTSSYSFVKGVTRSTTTTT